VRLGLEKQRITSHRGESVYLKCSSLQKKFSLEFQWLSYCPEIGSSERSPSISSDTVGL